MFMALILLTKKRARSFLSPPKCLTIDKERRKSMKYFKQILFAFALVIGISVSAQAQQDGKKTPPKERPPVIIIKIKPKPGEDKSKEDKPRDDRDEKGKKPESYILSFFGQN